MPSNSKTNSYRVLGTRWLVEARNPRVRALVQLGEPEQVAKHEWRCPYEIRGAGARGVKYAYGVDALQALSLAFQGIRALVDSLPHDLDWMGEPIELAFPRMIPYFGSNKFTRRLQKMVDQELAANLKLQEERYQRRHAKRGGGPAWLRLGVIA